MRQGVTHIGFDAHAVQIKGTRQVIHQRIETGVTIALFEDPGGRCIELVDDISLKIQHQHFITHGLQRESFALLWEHVRVYLAIYFR